MFTYSGWNAAAYMAEEVRDPGRNVPLALALGTAAVIVIYLLINVLYLYVMPIGELATGARAACSTSSPSGCSARAPATSWASCRSSAWRPSINAWTFAGPRVYFAMARDGVFFPAAARVHPRYKTPAISIVAQAVWATLLILTGSLDALANYVGLRDHAVCRHCRRRRLRAARARAERAASVQGDRLSGHAGDLRARQPRDGGQRHLPRAASSPASACS